MGWRVGCLLEGEEKLMIGCRSPVSSGWDGWDIIAENDDRRGYGRLGGGKVTERVGGLHVGVARGMRGLWCRLWVVLLLVEMKRRKRKVRKGKWKGQGRVCN